MMPEGLVKLRLRKYLDSHTGEHVWYFMPSANGYGRAGIPDIVGCYHGHFFAVECKAGKNTPTALQFRELHGIERTGGRAWVVNEQTLDKFYVEFEEWCDRVDESKHG
jgi:Holliday junction resolvase